MSQESCSGQEGTGGGVVAVTLAQLYAAGLSGADSTLTLDATRSGVVITASGLADVVPLTVNNTNTDTSGAQGVLAVTGSHTVASGTSTFRPLSVAYTVNQTGSASGAVTGIFVNATETAVLGAHNLLELQVGVAANNSRFAVANSGAVTVDCTATAAAVPLTLKNAKSESGIELWYTGTVKTGYGLMNASGALKGGLAIAAATNDWVTGSSADDIVIHGINTKKIHAGVKGSAPAVTIDLSNNKVGVGGAPVAGGGRLQVINAGAAEAQLFSDVMSICSYSTSDVYVGARDTTANCEAALGTATSGGQRGRVGSLTAHAFELFANNVQVCQLDSTGSALAMASAKKLQVDASSSLTDCPLQFVGDPNTGLARLGADVIAVVAGGVRVADWGTTGGTYYTDLTFSAGKNLICDTATGNKIGTAAGQKIGLWGVPPVVQQVLATGAGATVDNVITLLQTIGACKQV